jgi:glycosyltransferase involved in cell wall biosynthesis
MGDDILIHPFKSIFYNWLVMYAINNADFIICDGINSKNNLLAFGISPDKILVVYPGVNVQLFHPLYNIIRPDNKMIFYPRGFDKIYDTDTLFSVISIINKIDPDIKFMLLGLGTELERFKNMIISYGLEKSVKFLGQVPNNELPIYFAISDVSITTSLSDGGIPVSTIEAMACGIPVVSTDAGDAALWVRDGISGYVVKKQDPEQMVDRIIELLNDNEKRLRFGMNARKIVEIDQNYNLEMKKIENLYFKLLNDHL